MEENNQVNESAVVEQPEAQSAWDKFKQENPAPLTNTEEVAKENNIEASISTPEPEVTVITTNDLASSSSEPQVLGSVAEGVIGVTTAEPKPVNNSAKPVEPTEKAAIYSLKNISVPGLGKVYRGYNIVKKDSLDKWLEKSYIRAATPEEVAKEFGK
jgi:hypothetical protein